MGLFDKKTPVPAPSAPVGVPGVSGSTVAGTDPVSPVAQEPVAPTVAASTLTPQEPVSTSSSFSTPSTLGNDLTDDSTVASVNPTTVANEEPMAPDITEPEVSVPHAPVSVSSTTPTMGTTTVAGGMSSVSDEEPEMPEAPATSPLGSSIATDPGEDEDAGGIGGPVGPGSVK